MFALIILRTSQGFIAFKFIGDKITRFLDYTDVGSAFVFGENFAVHYIAFKVSRKLYYQNNGLTRDSVQNTPVIFSGVLAISYVDEEGKDDFYKRRKREGG